MCSLCSDNNGLYFTHNETEEVVIISRYMPKAYHNTINKDDSLRHLCHKVMTIVKILMLGFYKYNISFQETTLRLLFPHHLVSLKHLFLSETGFSSKQLH